MNAKVSMILPVVKATNWTCLLCARCDANRNEFVVRRRQPTWLNVRDGTVARTHTMDIYLRCLLYSILILIISKVRVFTMRHAHCHFEQTQESILVLSVCNLFISIRAVVCLQSNKVWRRVVSSLTSPHAPKLHNIQCISNNELVGAAKAFSLLYGMVWSGCDSITASTYE